MTDWEEDCMHWRGVVLEGKYAHWCFDWDGLPVDENCLEFMYCDCYSTADEDIKSIVTTLKAALRTAYDELS